MVRLQQRLLPWKNLHQGGQIGCFDCPRRSYSYWDEQFVVNIKNLFYFKLQSRNISLFQNAYTASLLYKGMEHKHSPLLPSSPVMKSMSPPKSLLNIPERSTKKSPLLKNSLITPVKDDLSVKTQQTPMTLKEQEKIIDKLSKDNFNLKLKISFLEERMTDLSPENMESALKEVISHSVVPLNNKLLECQQSGLDSTNDARLGETKEAAG